MSGDRGGGGAAAAADEEEKSADGDGCLLITYIYIATICMGKGEGKLLPIHAGQVGWLKTQ